MQRYKKHLMACAVVLCLASILGDTLAKPLLAQVRATLVRDIDTPALAPFRANIEYPMCCINDQRRVVTVPAGKRLVVEHISFYSSAQTGDEIIFGALRNGQFGSLVVVFELHPPHVSASSGFTIQEGSQPVKAYFEPGDDVWVSVSKSTGLSRNVQVQVNGYFVTP